MAKSEKTIAINAPVEKVFSYIDEPTNLLEIWPSIVKVKDVQRLPNGGTKFRFVYKLLGMRFEGTSEDIERVANQHVVTKTKGGIQSTQTWTFQPEAGGTKLTWQMEYTMPIPALGKLAEALAIKMNERELELVLANLKDRMEA